MNRRDFIKSTAVVGAAALVPQAVAKAKVADTVSIGWRCKEPIETVERSPEWLAYKYYKAIVWSSDGRVYDRMTYYTCLIDDLEAINDENVMKTVSERAQRHLEESIRKELINQ